MYPYGDEIMVRRQLGLPELLYPERNPSYYLVHTLTCLVQSIWSRAPACRDVPGAIVSHRTDRQEIRIKLSPGCKLGKSITIKILRKPDNNLQDLGQLYVIVIRLSSAFFLFNCTLKRGVERWVH